jgi:hypothetical protein
MVRYGTIARRATSSRIHSAAPHGRDTNLKAHITKATHAALAASILSFAVTARAGAIEPVTDINPGVSAPFYPSGSAELPDGRVVLSLCSTYSSPGSPTARKLARE